MVEFPKCSFVSLLSLDVRMFVRNSYALVSNALHLGLLFYRTSTGSVCVFTQYSVSHKESRSADPAGKRHKAWRLSVYVQRMLFKWKLLPLLPHAVLYLSSLPRVAGAGY